MTGSSKTIAVENAEKLLELFVQGFAAEESPGLSLQVSMAIRRRKRKARPIASLPNRRPSA